MVKSITASSPQTDDILMSIFRIIKISIPFGSTADLGKNWKEVKKTVWCSRQNYSKKLREACPSIGTWLRKLWSAAAAAAKSLQSCLTLCDPTAGSLPGFPVSGILQARTLEWVAISFSKTMVYQQLNVWDLITVMMKILYHCGKHI